MLPSTHKYLTCHALLSTLPPLQARLLIASASVRLELLSAEERLRNEPGCILEYSFTPGFPSAVSRAGTVPVLFVEAPSAFDLDVPHRHHVCSLVWNPHSCDAL